MPLPDKLLLEELVDLIVGVADDGVRQLWFLDPGDFARDLLDDLASPLFAHGQVFDRGDVSRASLAANVDDAGFGRLLRIPAKEGGLGLFCVAGLDMCQ